MNFDGLVFALLAIADLGLIVHLRRCQAQRVRTNRMMISLRMAVRRANGVEELPTKRRLLQAC